MEIIINARSGTVSVDKVIRAVVFPCGYLELDTVTYDTETAVGVGLIVGKITMGNILATSLGLWHGAEPTVITIWEEIQAKKDKVNANGVFVAGNWFHTDVVTVGHYSILLYTAIDNAYPDSYIFSTHWKTMQGTFTPMTVALLKHIIATGINNVAANFQNAQRHRASLIACAVPANYDYSTGWTIMYVR